MVKSTVKPSSSIYINGSHKHFNKAEEAGTGTFINSTPKWNEISKNKTNYTSKTDTQGQLVTEYKAGEYGVSETLTVTTHNPKTGDTVETIHKFDIKVPGLVSIDTSGKTYVVAGTFSTYCDTEHNNTASGEGRFSSYVTPRMKELIEQLDAAYYQELGHHLSFNDGSLKFGGVFDAGKSSRTARPCHVSHQKGIDIDVNSGYALLTEKLDTNGQVILKPDGNPKMIYAKEQPNCEDVNGYSLNCYVSSGEYGLRIKRRKNLDKIVKEIAGLKKIPEDPLHYRIK